MEEKISVLDIMYNSIVDGIGLRTVIFFASCQHKCPQCHNPESWNINNGSFLNVKELIEKIEVDKYTKKVTFSGGDPFDQYKSIAILAKQLKENGYNIWVYSGYTYEELLEDKNFIQLLSYCDVLVDGKYRHDLRDLTLPFRGSSNQRIIDVKKSLSEGRVVLFQL